MTKFRKIEQSKTFTRREQYANALTRTRAKNRAKSLSYVEIDIGDGEMANIYFTAMPASILKLREAGLDPVEAYNIIIQTLADCVIDPSTGEALMTADEWEKEDTDFINLVTSAVMGIQLVTESEAESLPGEDLIEVGDDADVDAISVASDPNPLDETPGSDSPTASTSNSEETET